MPFDAIAKLGRSRKGIIRKDVLKDVPGIQTRQEVKDIVLDVIKDRRTVREFQKTAIPDNVLIKILDAGRYAPSAGNQQPWEFIVIKNSETKKMLCTACFNQEFIADPPVVVVVGMNVHVSSSKYHERGEKLYGIQAVSAAIQNMLLAAEALGIGSCWVGSFSEQAVATITQCPNYVRPAAIVLFGYPAEDPPAPHRQPLIDIMHYEKFGETYLTKELYGSKELF
ncbi:MAG: nitroreductase family protein [Nanoarchaeota archaeon]|nr:nitroreductase family protein [Nanoarchaeota archaeon]